MLGFDYKCHTVSRSSQDRCIQQVRSLAGWSSYLKYMFSRSSLLSQGKKKKKKKKENSIERKNVSKRRQTAEADKIGAESKLGGGGRGRMKRGRRKRTND